MKVGDRVELIVAGFVGAGIANVPLGQRGFITKIEATHNPLAVVRFDNETEWWFYAKDLRLLNVLDLIAEQL